MNKIKFNKKAIELSINFIVMMIISLAIFGSGMKLTYDLYDKATKQSVQLNSQTQEQISSILDDGALVAIAFNEKTIQRTEKDVFGIGIFNTFGSSENDFYIKVDCYKGSDSNPTSNIGLLYENQHVIANNEKKIIKIQAVVDKTAEQGIYICNVCVGRDRSEIINQHCNTQVPKTDLYNNRIQKIYINVP